MSKQTFDITGVTDTQHSEVLITYSFSWSK